MKEGEGESVKEGEGKSEGGSGRGRGMRRECEGGREREGKRGERENTALK